MKLKVIIYAIFHKFFKLIGISIYFNDKYGIKAFNKQKFDCNAKNNKIISLSGKNIYLSFDALKDEYTLLDTPLIKSPHYDLVSRIYKGENIKKCEYVLREEAGKLDGRYNQMVNKKVLEFHKNKFNENLNKIKKEKCNPILVYFLNNKYYVLDGKHRAALCLLLNKKIPAILLSCDSFKNDKYTNDILLKMSKKEKIYGRNINHIRKILEKED